MIYPEFFPEDRESEKAEKFVFEKLKKQGKSYDVFYSRKFISTGLYKKPEYEIDFIIAIPNKAILCLEVKGGMIHYSGQKDVWTQGSKVMKKRPDAQSSGAAHALLKGYKDLIGDMAIGWGLCFPDCELNNQPLPSSIDSNQIIDQLGILYIDKELEQVFTFIGKQHSHKSGVPRWKYEKFKTELLRDIGFVQLLSTQIKYGEKRFVELTESQIGFFNRIAGNKNIITTGPAGSGKTIIAKTLAHSLIKDHKKVLLLCFNRTLANKIRYEFDRDEVNIEVSTFHSFARKIIDQCEPDWWKKNSKKEDFWELEAPVKMEECMPYYNERYDSIIIDEAQDFKELWFELLFALVQKDGSKYIFMDAMQDIFGHFTKIPNEETFSRYNLTENCRNTKTIVNYLSEIVSKNIKTFSGSPEGDVVVLESFKNQIEQQKYVLDEIKSLTQEQGINTEQILILLNSPKDESCLGKTSKAGKFEIKAIDNKGRFQRDAINYTTINTFKGLEADIVFIVDTQLIEKGQKLEKLYTQASRARHKLYILS